MTVVEPVPTEAAVPPPAAPVDRFVDAIAAGAGVPDGVFAADAVVDATVPMWRFTMRGAERIRHQLAGWFAAPARYEELHRLPVSGGELLEFTLVWEERGVPYACHQSHRIAVEGGRIVRDTVFCGGRWDAGLLAEIADADHAAS